MCSAEDLGTQASPENLRGGKGLQASGTSQGMQKESFLLCRPVRRWEERFLRAQNLRRRKTRLLVANGNWADKEGRFPVVNYSDG